MLWRQEVKRCVHTLERKGRPSLIVQVFSCMFSVRSGCQGHSEEELDHQNWRNNISTPVMERLKIPRYASKKITHSIVARATASAPSLAEYQTGGSIALTSPRAATRWIATEECTLLVMMCATPRRVRMFDLLRRMSEEHTQSGHDCTHWCPGMRSVPYWTITLLESAIEQLEQL